MFPETYMAPTHYPMAHPRYEYDKPMDHHCCGCSNHLGNRKEDRPVRIEEQEPEAEKVKNGNSLVPVDFHKEDYPYPVMWIPPGYMKNGENRKLLEAETKTKDENSRPSEDKPNKSQGVWFPFDIKNLGGHVENGQELKKSEKEKTLDKNQFPFPIFWMPYKPAEKEGKDKTEAPTGSESAKTLPTQQSKSLDEGSGVDGSSKPVEGKVVKLKTIPVKQLEEAQEKERDNGVKSTKQSSEKKPSEAGTRRESSPNNASKLPPVCLRVEPLKRRSRSVGSRSPSPPGDKEKHAVRSSSSIMEKTRDVQRNEGNGQVVEEKKSPASIKPANAAAMEAEGKVIAQEVSNSVFTDAAKGSREEVKSRKMSEEEAALIIQTAFRGYGVRKWEPLKKLKQIALVKHQVTEVRKRIEAFELSEDVGGIDKKQKLVIGETIMSLLLKLDTIQGLHPMIREIRKAVAKELVSLQEKLDSLATEKPGAPIANPMVPLSVDNKDSAPAPAQEEEKEAEAAERNIEDGKNSFQTYCVQSEELQSIPNVEEKKADKDSEDETPASLLGHGEELRSDHAKDGDNGGVEQKDEMLNLAAGESGDYKTPSTPDVVNQEFAVEEATVEEAQRNEKIQSCDCEVVQGENLSFQGDEEEAAEDMSKSEDGVAVKKNEPFDLPSTEEHNEKALDEASDTSEVTYVTQPQLPRTEESCTELIPGFASEDCNADAPKSETSLEKDVTGVPQTVETTEAPTSEVPLEENGIPLVNASQLEEPSIKDESFVDKEVIEEAQIESGIGGENVESTEEVPSQESVQSGIELAGEEKKEPLQENALKKTENDQNLLEENQRLRKMMEELIKAGNEQLSAITDLSGKVKYLERKLARKKKVKTRRTKSAKERIEEIAV